MPGQAAGCEAEASSSGWRTSGGVGRPRPRSPREAEARCKRGRPHALGARAGNGAPPGPHRPVQTWVVVGHYGGRLLWGPGEDSRNNPEAGSGEGLQLSSSASQRDRPRRGPASTQWDEGSGLPGAHLPPTVRPPGEWRLSSPWAERQAPQGRRRGRLGHQPGAPCHGGRGRARDVEEAGAGAPAREGREGPCVPITSRPTPGTEGARGGRDPEKEEEKEEEESKGGRRGTGERETRGQGISEGAVAGFRGHGPRPAGEDQEESPQEGTEVRGAKKEQALQLQQQSREQWLLDQRIEWRAGDRGGLLGGDKGKRPFRALPGGSVGRDAFEYAAEPFGDVEDGDLQSTKPVALLYYRNVLGRKATGAQARELLTLSSAVDALLRGRVALVTDILCQRLKAQESVLAGTPWQVAQKVEIASAEATALIARGELQAAQRESYLDSKTKWQNLASTPKGQPKGKGKGKSDKDGGKDERREESRKDKGKGGEKK